jgi:hypothetical protein
MAAREMSNKRQGEIQSVFLGLVKVVGALSLSQWEYKSLEVVEENDN